MPATDPKRRALMQRVRQKGTPAERIVAGICRSVGLHYRLNVRSLPGSPDIANKSKRWAIFVNGCFWHHHTNCRSATIPKVNRLFWKAKFVGNRRRDAAKVKLLRNAGFATLIVWECEIADSETLKKKLSKLSEPRRIDAG